MTSRSEMENRCVFSPDRRHRYVLEYRDPDPPLFAGEHAGDLLPWLCLNPSTADENKLDNTLRRIRAYSLAAGYGGFVMLNCFAYRATEPADMKAAEDPVGPENNAHIMEHCLKAGRVVCGWGNHGMFRNRDLEVYQLLTEAGVKLECLKRTSLGAPEHPLYLKKTLTPVVYLGRSGNEKRLDTNAQLLSALAQRTRRAL